MIILSFIFRDYRWYESDMIHPTQQAIEIIFNRFIQEYFDDESIEYMKELKSLNSNLNHNIMNKDSKVSESFYINTLKKIKDIESKYNINLVKEKINFINKFNQSF